MWIRQFYLLLTILLVFPDRDLSAQVANSDFSCEEQLETEEVEKNLSNPQGNTITNETISERGLTVPSLWWPEEQFDPFGGRLVESWIAYRDKRQINIIVNRQLWSILDYVRRYQFMNQFGTVARTYKYKVGVFNQQQRCLATYICDFEKAPYQCEINFDPSGQVGLQINSSPLPVDATPKNW